MQRVLEWEANKKQTAVFFGISVQALDGWINKGCPCEKRGKFLIFYLPEVLEWRDSRDTNSGKLDLTAERARLSKEQADKIAMENARLRGELVPVTAVRALLEKVLSTFKTRVLSIPSKLAPLLLGMTTINEVRESIEEHLHDGLHELSRLNVSELRGRGGAAGGKAATKADSKRVGRQRKKAQPRGKRRTRAVANK